MSNATLTPPAHLVGPLAPHVASALLAERDAWIMARVGEGHSYRAVAGAVGISANAVVLAMRRARGVKKPAAAPRAVSGPLKFHVVGETPRGERIGHVIRAEDDAAAGARWLRSYPAGSSIVDVRLLGAEAEE